MIIYLWGKILNIPLCVIIVKSVFQENNKYYPQAYLHLCFYEYEYGYEDMNIDMKMILIP